MPKTISVILDDHLTEFVAVLMKQGHFASASEVVQAGLQLLELEGKRQALRAAIIEGEESGPSEEFDGAEFVTEMRARSRPR